MMPHLFRPRTFDEFRIQNFLPPVQALYIRPVLETFRFRKNNTSEVSLSIYMTKNIDKRSEVVLQVSNQ